MLFIETRGTWREMGRQYGEAARSLIHKAIAYFGPWLLTDAAKAARVAGYMRPHIGTVAPEALDEIDGMAEGAGISSDAMLCVRFLPEVSTALKLGCTVVYLQDSDRGPLLGRNEDIEPDVSVEIQVCHTCRPIDGPATMLLTYVGFMAGAGMNEHGVGIGATSAHTTKADGVGNLPFSLFWHLLLNRCRSVKEVQSKLSSQTFYGKTCAGVIGDATGASMAFEMNPGEPIVYPARRQDRDWQICTNHYVQSIDQMAMEPAYLQNSYARYGRLTHRLGDAPMPRTVDHLKNLMTEVAAPGLCILEQDLKLRTAYTTIFELQHCRTILLDGHPSTAPIREISL